MINFFFLKKIEKKYPGDLDKIKKLSIIDEGPPKRLRMANLVNLTNFVYFLSVLLDHTLSTVLLLFILNLLRKLSSQTSMNYIPRNSRTRLMV